MEDPIEVGNCDVENLPNHEVDHEEVAIVMVPFLAQGDINQLLQLAYLISSSYTLPVYYVGSSTHNHQFRIRANALNHSEIDKINFHDIPTPEFASPHLSLMPQADPHHIFFHYGMHLCLCESSLLPFFTQYLL